MVPELRCGHWGGIGTEVWTLEWYRAWAVLRWVRVGPSQRGSSLTTLNAHNRDVTEAQLVWYRLESGGEERLREWAEEVQSRRDEAVQTLRDEGTLTETAFLESRSDGDYVSFYMEAEDLAAAHEAFEESDHDIDEEFAQVLAEVTADDQPDAEVETLYHLTNPARS